MENPSGTFDRLYNRYFDRLQYEQSLADIYAMRLGWGSSAYAWPGRVRAGSRTAAGDLSTWVIFPHPALTDAQISEWLREGAVVALRNLNEPPERFFALLDGQL